MKAKAVVWLCAAAIVVPAWAQAATYEGVVIGTNVYVRSGPGGEGAYPCTKLSAPAKVTVVDKLDDWLKILPAPGCFSVISKQYVTVDPVTKIGTVTGDNVWVRAAGVLRSESFFTLQLRLNRGDRVTVIGDAGEYHRIQSPTGACFWISGRYVKRAGTVVVPVPPTTQRISVVPTTRPVPDTPRVVATTAPVGPPRTATAEIQVFRGAEKLLIQECMKPIEARDLDPILARYKAIPVTGNSAFLKPYVEARVAFIQAAMERKKDYQAVKNLVTEVSEREKALKLEQARLESEAPTTRPVTAFVTQGVLLPSDVFPGGLGTPRRYIVRDRHTFFINAYVQCVTNVVNLQECVGKHVGIMGTTKFDMNLGLDIVEATDLKVLASDVSFPRPPKPIIQPAPKLLPIPTPATQPAAPIAPTPLVVKPTTRPAPIIGPVPVVIPPPVVKPTPEPTTWPAPIIRPAPVIIPPPVVKPTPEPTTWPAPIVRPAPVVIPAPVVKPTPEPTTRPAPIIRPAPVVIPAPVVKPTPEPTTRPAPIIRPAPVIITPPVVKPTTKPAPIIKPAPVVLPKPVVKPTPKPTPPVTPVVRFGPPKPTSRPTTMPAPTTMPTTVPAAIDPTKRQVKPIVEEEYD